MEFDLKKKIKKFVLRIINLVESIAKILADNTIVNKL
jgi:hypothetical protein